jgi:hypothetical protein
VRQRMPLCIGVIGLLSLCGCTSEASVSTPTTKPVTTTSLAPSTTSTSVTATLPASCIGNPPTIPPGALYQIPLNHCAHLTVSATRLNVGMELNVSGDSCNAGYLGTVLIDQTLDQPLPIGVTSLQAQFGNWSDRTVAGSDGRWSIDTTVPLVARGQAILESACLPGNLPTSTIAFRYSNVPVTIETAAQISVSPGAVVVQGTTLTISTTTPCPVTSLPMAMLVNPVTTADMKPYGGTPTDSEGGQGWPVTLMISAATPPGAYLLEASCFVRDRLRPENYQGVYEPLSVTVK